MEPLEPLTCSWEQMYSAVLCCTVGGLDHLDLRRLLRPNSGGYWLAQLVPVAKAAIATLLLQVGLKWTIAVYLRDELVSPAKGNVARAIAVHPGLDEKE